MVVLHRYQFAHTIYSLSDVLLNGLLVLTKLKFNDFVVGAAEVAVHYLGIDCVDKFVDEDGNVLMSDVDCVDLFTADSCFYHFVEILNLKFELFSQIGLTECFKVA